MTQPGPRGPASEHAAALPDRLADVQARIAAAATDHGRAPADVRLIAVSKGQPVAAIEAAWTAGQRDFGENYVQEWQAKAAALAHLPDLRWHFLGHLQRNKGKLVLGRVAVLHSVDDMVGIDALARAAHEAHVAQDVCLQINLAEETSKRGCTADDAELFCDVLLRSPGLRLRGLMTLPPPRDAAEFARPWFARLRTLRDRLARTLAGRPGVPPPHDWWLSMGMSGDFEVAIAEGATHVRVGTAIFGPRA
ncbi:MAG: YggS family pyridoxal phosphate-dependent enzyme [Myxococcales bacterium]|nr:YggS family pyridoxal phosphate-dependent enzyme [Myxococcales bacterium]